MKIKGTVVSLLSVFSLHGAFAQNSTYNDETEEQFHLRTLAAEMPEVVVDLVDGNSTDLTQVNITEGNTTALNETFTKEDKVIELTAEEVKQIVDTVSTATTLWSAGKNVYATLCSYSPESCAYLEEHSYATIGFSVAGIGAVIAVKYYLSPSNSSLLTVVSISALGLAKLLLGADKVIDVVDDATDHTNKKLHHAREVLDTAAHNTEILEEKIETLAEEFGAQKAG